MVHSEVGVPIMLVQVHVCSPAVADDDGPRADTSKDDGQKSRFISFVGEADLNSQRRHLQQKPSL